MTNKSTSNQVVWPIVFMVISLAFALLVVKRKTNLLPKATTNYQNFQLNEQVSKVGSFDDLSDQKQQLDEINIDQMGAAIDDNVEDANSF